MKWRVIAYESTRKEKPVEDFIKTLSDKTGPKIAHLITLLEVYGNLFRMPHSKKLTKDIFELRTKGKENIRILYAFGNNGAIYLLNGFKKKTQKTPAKEIRIAEVRLNKCLTNS